MAWRLRRAQRLDVTKIADLDRMQALVRLLRSRAYRRLLSELPGYDARQTGELFGV